MITDLEPDILECEVKWALGKHHYKHALEKEMAAHSSVLAWRIPGMGKPGGLQSMGSLDMTERLHFHFSLSCMKKEMATHSSVLALRIPGTGD